MPEKVSHFRVVSDATFRDSLGSPIKLIFATRTARTLPVPLDLAYALAAGYLPDDVDDVVLKELRLAELLVDSAEDEFLTVLHRSRAAADDPSRRHIALLPGSYCNMGCIYCGQEHVRGVMNGVHRSAVLARVGAVLASPGLRSMRLDWFGGEPLLAFDVIRDLSRNFIPRVRELDINWMSVIVTNGALLDRRKIRILERECLVTHAEITIDGPARIHDVHRPLKSGKGSYEQILATIKKSIDDPEGSMFFSLRTNVDRHNIDFVGELLEDLAARGMSHRRVRLSFSPVHTWSNDISQIAVQRTNYAERELGWLRRCLDLGLRVGLIPSTTAGVPCTAVSRYSELISPAGDVFSCSEEPLVPKSIPLRVGRIETPMFATDAPRPPGLYDSWKETVAAGGQPCSRCALLPVCGGGCPKHWAEGSIPCPPIKTNIQGRFELVASLNQMTPATPPTSWEVLK